MLFRLKHLITAYLIIGKFLIDVNVILPLKSAQTINKEETNKRLYSESDFLLFFSLINTLSQQSGNRSFY